MIDLLYRAERSVVVPVALGIAALTGWGSFAYSAWSSSQLSRQVGTLIAERNEALEMNRRLGEAAGELKQLEAKLAAARTEYNRVMQLIEAKARLAAAQEEVGAAAKRVEQARDRERVSQTGSIGKVEPPKRPSR